MVLNDPSPQSRRVFLFQTELGVLSVVKKCQCGICLWLICYNTVES